MKSPRHRLLVWVADLSRGQFVAPELRMATFDRDARFEA
jgi:hypothetical protein